MTRRAEADIYMAAGPAPIGWGARADPLAVLAARNDRLLVGSIAAYALLLAGLMLAHGVAMTPDVAAVGIALAGVLVVRTGVRTRPRIAGRVPELFLELLPLGALFLAYELMRGYTAAGTGTVHGADVLDAERWLFMGNLPTQVLQGAFHVPGDVDLLAMAGTVFYVLHFGLPFAVGVLLWRRSRAAFHDFIGALILLSIAGFATYLILPVAPPWYAAQTGALGSAGTLPAIHYLKMDGFNSLVRLLGLDGTGAFQFAVHDVNPNLVGAFPSLHAGYPTLAFLVLRRTFGRPAWLMLVYAAAVWISVVYLADHYVVDILGGIAYACVAAWIVTRPRLSIPWADPGPRTGLAGS